MNSQRFSPQHTPYANARFDGYLVFDSVQAGMVKIGMSSAPVVRFNVVTGIQRHPVFALDKLAIVIFSYCKAAQELCMNDTQLQTSWTASWVSTDNYSNLVATHVEWHTSPKVRVAAQRMLAEFESGRPSWPNDLLFFPGQ
jgi:hypothetical protein